MTQGDLYSISQGDCLPWLRSLQDATVDCVFVDLPYFGVVDDDWDNQWKDRNDYLDWVVMLAHEWKRITKNNSSIFVFCDEKMEAYIQVRLDEIFLLLNKIVWYRKTNEMKKFAQNFRTFAPATERALFYTTQADVTGLESVKLDVNNFVSLREYFREFQNALGMNIKKINSKLGHRKSEHAFYWNSTQWDLPTAETYDELLALKFNHGFKPREYESLRREYESLRRENADNNTFDVLEFPAFDNNAGKIDHSTVKPVPLCRRIISVITNPGQVVLDCCMGSGTAGVAAVQLGRYFLGRELKPEYFTIAESRIKEAAAAPSFDTLNYKEQKTDDENFSQNQFPGFE